MEQVTISEYDPLWVKEYETEKVKIVKELDDILLGIEHIGSTSIPGLAAKPIIDIMAGVRSLEDITDIYKERLQNIGYEFVEHAHLPQRRFFRRGAWGAGTHHLHIYEYKQNHWNKNLFFKEYLINHPEILKEYCNLKKQLERRYKNDRVAYTKAKEPFIEEILNKFN
ncbi:GrpB family protein [Paenibacillus turpanensis]|uniref:GrpB family protein n=1 Tax=Paenibacillus turpanensis TaxID=2689078 RepID=UPI001407F0FE|nr:GrpB family protein [Paenibacillus turpanensis]